jgi:exopolysaccharide production protein ExoY
MRRKAPTTRNHNGVTFMKSATRSASLPFDASEEMQLAFPTGGLVKRTFDVTAALAALIVFSPLFLMIMALVKFSDGGSVFYGHKRVGHNGRYFKCLKFRTMVPNGDEVLRKYLHNNPEAAEEWQATRKLKDDPRVTAVGTVLRKLSLDELPQLLNIIRGDMSVVGPRPVVDEELTLYDSFAVYYLHTRPGLTGLWQISGRNDVSYESRIAFDTHYVQNWSLMTDMSIILKTIPAVCLSRGSY